MTQKDYLQNGFCHLNRIITSDLAHEILQNYKSLGGNESAKFYNFHQQDKNLSDIALGSELPKVIEKLCKFRVSFESSAVFAKAPKDPSYVTAHQDRAEKNDDNPAEYLTVWLALTKSTRKMGAMYFVPKTHLKELPHDWSPKVNSLLNQECYVENYEDRQWIDLLPGEASLHHGLIVHGSDENFTNDWRIGVALRFRKKRTYITKALQKIKKVAKI